MEVWMSDEELVRAVRDGNTSCFAVLMRRYNQRLYRVALAILRDESEAEDVIQQTYVNAYFHLDQFADRARFSTWLTRIAIHEALARSRKAARMTRVEVLTHEEEVMAAPLRTSGPDPEQRAYSSELSAHIEAAVAQLPDDFRGVFMLRDVEGLSTHETAACLGLNEVTVKTRLHRARVLLRRALTIQLGPAASTAFQFHAPRCDRVVAAVFARLGPEATDIERGSSSAGAAGLDGADRSGQLPS